MPCKLLLLLPFSLLLHLSRRKCIEKGIQKGSCFCNFGALEHAFCVFRPIGASHASNYIFLLFFNVFRASLNGIAGKNELHRRLQVDEHTQEPRMVIFNNCTQLISQLPSLPLDKKNSEDVDTNAMDHMYDALRYGIMTRPRSSMWDYNPANQRTGFQVADPSFGY